MTVAKLLAAAEICRIGYIADIGQAKKLYLDLGYKAVFFPGTEAFLLKNDIEQVLIFVGTDETEEWVNNADIRKDDEDLHQGFSDALTIIWRDILRNLDDDLPIYITGHSRGAALAVLATKDLYGFYDVRETYTFGAPRAMGYKAASNYPDQTYRVVNNNDIVCRVPAPLRFKHVGRLVYINRHGKIHFNGGFFKDIWDRLAGRFSRRVDGVKDHNINEYVKHLREAV